MDDTVYELNYKDCLYLIMGVREAPFSSADAAAPAKFYMLSAPAHRAYETKLLTLAHAAKRPRGDTALSKKRVINPY